ncbi:MAG TPA: rhomboid-like protein [Pseudonocardiaceae bacterium]|nr:rhomboid-like protein [Pseudonocardiaceae bacterium]
MSEQVAGPSWPARIGRRAGAVLRLLPSPRTTPFTFWYLGLLGLTTILLHFGRPTAVHRLLAMSSTDAVNLQRHPIQVLFLSALWLVDAHWLVYAAIFTIVLAPLERRIGTKWAVLVFASGHVLATLATELPVLWAVRSHLLPTVDAHLLDVGVSYGFFAAAGALLLVLPTPVRWCVLGLLNASIVVIYLSTDPTSTGAVVTVAGHTLSLYIGMLGWLPLLRRRGMIGSLRLPRMPAGRPTTVAAPAGT